MNNWKGRPGLFRAALLGLCPRCGSAGVFAEVAQLKDQCGTCGLNFAAYRTSERLFALLAMGLAIVVASLAIWLDDMFHLPLLAFVLLLIPVTAALVIGGLRAAKVLLLTRKYRKIYSAREQ